MRIRILGPLEIGRAGQWRRLPAAKSRALLAALITRAGQPTSVDRLILELWPDTPPPRTATNQIHGYVARLRRTLNDPGGRLLCTRSPGYELVLGPDDLDAACFDDLAQQGVRSLRDGDPAEAAEQLGRALALWRGPAFADVPRSHAVQAEADRLDEARLSALDKRIDADLALGRHEELVAELRALTETNPYREPQWTRLMLSLYRSGRQGEALQTYQRLYGLLDRELGVEPGGEIRRLHQRILGADPTLDVAGSSAAVVPRQLPAVARHFVGRGAELEALDALSSEDGGTVVISAISGMPGVGKTTLALHWAQRSAGQFPDGQLYVNLRGFDPSGQALAPATAVAGFLDALGVPAEAIPSSLESRTALYRSLLAGRRMLVVLDNARDVDQVRTLLPGAPGCLALVTSRDQLTGLVVAEGARPMSIDLLNAEEARQLLAEHLGADRVAAEPAAAATLVEQCGRLPLALTVAAARAAVAPGISLAALADDLCRRRLRALHTGEDATSACAVFSWSYRALEPDAGRLFRLLGLPSGPDISVPVAARLGGITTGETRHLLDHLASAHLVAEHVPERYVLHDLLRLYAHEQAACQDTEAERTAALTRAFGFYAASAWRTLARLRPGDHRLHLADPRWTTGGLEFANDIAAFDWLATERANLVAAVRQAAATPGVPSEIAIQLAHALFGFFEARSHWQDWMQINHTALGIAQQTGDLPAQAQAHNDIGIAHFQQGQYDQALASHQRSLRVRDELGDRSGRSATLNNLANIYQRQGGHEQALDHYRESLAIRREMGDRRGQAGTLGNLGQVHVRQGHYQEALACQRESLAIFRELGDRRSQATALHDLGIVNQRQGHHQEALACQRESLAIFRELGDGPGQADALQDLGAVQQQQGRLVEALASMRASLVIREQCGQPQCQAESRRELGMVLGTLGRIDEAREQWRQALAIFQRLNIADDADQVRALLATNRSDP